MKRYETPMALDHSNKILNGKAISRVLPKTFAGGLHEALIGAEVVGYVELSFDDGSTSPALLVRRQRPFIPCGIDPKIVNMECARLFAIIPREQTGPWAHEDGERFDVVEVTP